MDTNKELNNLLFVWISNPVVSCLAETQKMSYPSIIPVKPDVDMVVLPSQFDVQAGSSSSIAVPSPDTAFFFPKIDLTDSLAASPVLQMTVEFSFRPTSSNADFSIGVSPTSNVVDTTQSSRSLVIDPIPNWVSGTATFVLFKDVDWDSAVDKALYVGIASGTAEAPIFDGSNLGYSYIISTVP